MINYLEYLLQSKTQGTQSAILYAQWNYDKQVIPSALNAVSHLFPHYSLHDESHSITIINNIVRVLGKDKLEKLSAIDIWLILEASYCHDIGMVVSHTEILKTLNSDDFYDFFIEIQNDKKNGLNEFASKFIVVDRKIKYGIDELNLEYHDGIKFILAEYFRRKHADRSKEIIINPDSELKLSSPRGGVIPPRIFKILADICSSHTKKFEDVMCLPFCEVGIDVEDAHPRFISCLLRIGDLLDLDNNRFSEVMLRTLSKIPIDTLNHKAKHLSIESFRVDNEIIEVKAKCFDYDTATITQHWFNYLNSEISQQMISWNNIVPYKEFGFLPTIGNLKVELFNYDYIDGKKKPKFSVDTDKALELLQGAGIYEGASQCIREILQNAVDATLLRVWLEHKDRITFGSPNDQDFIDVLKNYPISININEKGIEEDHKIWEITVSDKGIGLSSNDLTFLMNTGSSSKNRKKLNIIESMPLWLRPSGTFGIGFQSIFMLTDQVKIETKCYFDEEYQLIELNSPNSIKDGGILIQRRKTGHNVKPGTTLTFEHKTKAVPERWSIKTEQKNASRIAHNYDPFSQESLDIELGKIFDEIFDFSSKINIPVNVNMNESEILTHKQKWIFDYFDKGNALELSVLKGDKKSHFRNLTYFKNQKCENTLMFKFIGFAINIHKDKASEVLTLNRNKIKKDYQNESLYQQILTSSFRIIIENFDEIFYDNDSKCIGSMYLHYYQPNYDFLEGFNVSKFNQWEKMKIEVGTKQMELKKLLNSVESVNLTYLRNIHAPHGDFFTLNGKELTIKLSGGGPMYYFTEFILMQIGKKMSFVQKIIQKKEGKSTYVFSKKKQINPVGDSDIVQVIVDSHRSFSSRVIIPCIERYNNLRLKDSAHEGYVYHYRFSYHVDIKYPKMLSPFITIKDTNDKQYFKIELNERLYNWVYKNRYDDNTTLEEIKNAYVKFTEEYKIDELNKKIDEEDSGYLDD